MVIWLLREATHVLVEAAAQLEGSTADRVHGALTSDRIHASADGRVRLSGFGVGAVDKSGPSDVSRVLELLEALVPEPRPAAIRALLTRVRSSDRRDLRALESGLSRVFYAELEGDDVVHGQDAVAAAVAKETGAATSVQTRPQEVDGSGELTRALEARKRPVMPQPLTVADQPTGLRHSAPKGNDPPARSTARRATKTRRSLGPVVTAVFWFTLGFVVAIGLVIVDRKVRTGQNSAIEVSSER